MAHDYNTGDLVAEFLGRCGIATAFGVISVHNIPILDAIARRNTIRFVMARGEAGAGHMADGYGRATGGLSVLITSTGPGSANAAAALAEAYSAGTPLLHITGQTTARYIGRGMGCVHDMPNQLGMLRSLCKAAYRIRSTQEALGILTQAAVVALSPPCGPVSVEIPIDLQRAELERPRKLDDFSLPPPDRKPPAPQDLDRLVEIVLSARRPMLWAGRGAREAGDAICRLLDMGFCMVTSWAGRGIVSEDHPNNLGALHGPELPCVEDFYETVDLMLVVGSRLRGHETLDFSLRLPKALVQIDVDPCAEGRTYASKLFVCGDSVATLDALVDRIDGRLEIEPPFVPEFRALKEQAQSQFRDTLGPYADFPRQLRQAMPRDAVWARDLTVSNTTWGNRLFPIHSPYDNIYPTGAGIGQGLGLGIGAALAANGRKVVIMTGDGGLLLNLGELWTIVQEQLNVVIIVMNDRGYGVIKHIQDALYGGRRTYADLVVPDLSGLARLAGIKFSRVVGAGDFGAAAAKAMAANGPAMIEVDMTAIGAHPLYFPYSAVASRKGRS